MPNWQVYSFLFAFAAVVGAIAYLSNRAERRRVEALQELAPTLGFSLTPGSLKPEDASIDATVLSLPLLRRGRSRRVRNVMRAQGAAGEQVLLDYRYTVSSGKSSHVVEQTVLAACWRGVQIPAFRLHPERVTDRIAQWFGAANIEFDSNPEFSKSYALSGPDPDELRGYFERHAVAFFGSTPGWNVEGSGEWVIVFHAGRREKPEGLSAFLESARQVARLFQSR